MNQLVISIIETQSIGRARLELDDHGRFVVAYILHVAYLALVIFMDFFFLSIEFQICIKVFSCHFIPHS